LKDLAVSGNNMENAHQHHQFVSCDSTNSNDSMKYLILLTVVAALACLILGILKWKQRPQDQPFQTVSELRKAIRAAAEGASQVPLQKSVEPGKDVTGKLDLYAEKTYAPLGTTTDQILSHENDDKKEHVYFALLWRIGQKLDKRGWDRLSDTERRLVAVQAMEGEVLNGGFDQYFFNSMGGDAEVALAGLKEMGATQAAPLLERAMAVFPGGKPPTDRQERWKVMDQIESSSKPVWNKCDDAFYKRSEDLGELSLAYAKKSRAQIVLP
jgi:Domain of unknown function (DUF4375)